MDQLASKVSQDLLGQMATQDHQDHQDLQDLQEYTVVLERWEIQ